MSRRYYYRWLPTVWLVAWVPCSAYVNPVMCGCRERPEARQAPPYRRRRWILWRSARPPRWTRMPTPPCTAPLYPRERGSPPPPNPAPPFTPGGPGVFASAANVPYYGILTVNNFVTMSAVVYKIFNTPRQQYVTGKCFILRTLWW